MTHVGPGKVVVLDAYQEERFHANVLPIISGTNAGRTFSAKEATSLIKHQIVRYLIQGVTN